jgi:carboxymethylenebutenolidase
MAFLLSARGEADCNVGYFGTRIDKHIAEAAHLSRPLLLHIPEQDRFVPPEAQAVIRKHLEGKAEIYTYPNADHAFNRIGAESYNAEVTALADERTESFLKRHLAT